MEKNKKIAKNPATPRTPEAQQLNALMVEFGAGHYQRVAELARSLTIQCPQHGFGWIALGVALKQMGQPNDALPALQKAAKDSEPLIAEHARWAMDRIQGKE